MNDKTGKMVPTEVSIFDVPPVIRALMLEKAQPMTPTEFCYWLQGYLEMSDCKAMDEGKIDCLRKHLDLVFAHHIDPKAGGPEQQAKLNAIHNPDPNAPRPRC